MLLLQFEGFFVVAGVLCPVLLFPQGTIAANLQSTGGPNPWAELLQNSVHSGYSVEKRRAMFRYLSSCVKYHALSNIQLQFVWTKGLS